jgi:hypothetical protein
LLLQKSPNVEREFVINNRGKVQEVLKVKDYDINWHNRWAAVVVALWLYLLFLLIVGFGYSYFWTASTIIYLLMRQKVDDTEMDEIHLEEEPEQPFPVPSSMAPSPADPGMSGQSPLQMVEPPTMRGSGAATSPLNPPPAAEPARETPRGDGPVPPGGTN